MEYDFDRTMPDLRDRPLEWQPTGDTREPWPVGQAIANALLSPNPEVKGNFARRLMLADRLARGGSGKLTTDERKQVIDASSAVYGQTMPIVAGRIEQFIEREGPFAVADSADAK